MPARPLRVLQQAVCLSSILCKPESRFTPADQGVMRSPMPAIPAYTRSFQSQRKQETWRSKSCNLPIERHSRYEASRRKQLQQSCLRCAEALLQYWRVLCSRC